MIAINFFKNLYTHIKYSRLINKIYKDERVIENLSELFGTNFKIDRIGRVYAVINPLIKNGQYDPNDVIYEYGESGLNTDEFIERGIMRKLNAAQQFINANNLFELLTYDITKLDNYGNYRFIFQPITLEDCLNSTKKFSILILVLVVIATVLFCIF